VVMPVQKPFKSRQDYSTPPELLVALKKRLHINEFLIDLAATLENTVAPHYYTETQNSLVQPWNVFEDRNGWSFCNPPFANLAPWVEKAHMESYGCGAYVAMLVPASPGSNWWKHYVDRVAYVLFLSGRLTFVGETAPYPKDCAILLYTPMRMVGYECWNWREE
jgi:phage N-6-adenine-methyltransferase